jgi:hypothetical protein
VAGPVTNTAVAVSNGQFIVTVDFGSNVFNGTPYWLEIAVQTNGVADFVTLQPRQQITATPYAVYSAQAGTAAMAASANSVSATNLAGKIAMAQLPFSVLTNGQGGVNLNGTFSGNAQGLTNLVLPSTNEIWVKSGGSDANQGTNQASPFLTIAKALLVASNLNGGAVIYVGPGTFAISNLYVSTNTAIIGSGMNQTFLVPTLVPAGSSIIVSGLALNGDNILLRDFTIGALWTNGAYAFPLVPSYGTNCWIQRVIGLGDSDVFYMNSIRAPMDYTVEDCFFESHYDCLFVGARNVPPGWANDFRVRRSTFTVINQTQWTNFPARGICWQGNASLELDDCSFCVTNYSTNISAGIYLFPGSPNNGNVTVKGNIFSVTNLGSANFANICQSSSSVSLKLEGGINPAGISSSGGKIAYDSVIYSNVTVAGTYTGNGSGLTNIFSPGGGPSHPIASTGITNTGTRFGVAMVTATSATFSVYNSSGEIVGTHNSVTGIIPIILAPGGMVKATNGLAGYLYYP